MFRSEPEEALARKNTCKPEEAVGKEYLVQAWRGCGKRILVKPEVAGVKQYLYLCKDSENLVIAK